MSVHDTLPRRLTAPQLVGAVAGQEQPRSSWLVLRYLGALAVLAVGLVHLQQYFGPYAQIPTIEVAAAVLLGASLIARFAGKAPKARW